jgi:hypothetical protein
MVDPTQAYLLLGATMIVPGIVVLVILLWLGVRKTRPRG